MSLDFSVLERKIAEQGSMEILPNGICLITENVPNSGLISGQGVVFAGSAHETPGDEGVMHFLEHMCFEESRSYSNPYERLVRANELGFNPNAGTSPFCIVYDVQGANSSWQLLQANFVESFCMTTDMMFYPQLGEDTRTKQEEIISRELAELQQATALNPAHKINEAMTRKLWSRSPHLLKGHNLGKEETIRAVTVDKLRAYHERFFVGHNALFSMVGDLNGESRIVEQVKENLSSVVAGQAVEPLDRPEEEPFVGREQMEFTLSGKSDTNVGIYFRAPAPHTLESCALNGIAHILGSGLLSLLYQDLREQRNLVYSLDVQSQGTTSAGLLLVQFDVDPDKETEALEAVDTNLDKLRRGDFPEGLWMHLRLKKFLMLFGAYNSLAGYKLNSINVIKRNVSAMVLQAYKN